MAKIPPIVGTLEDKQVLKLTDLSIHFGGLRRLKAFPSM